MINFLNFIFIIETGRLEYSFYHIASTAQNLDERWVTSNWKPKITRIVNLLPGKLSRATKYIGINT